MFPKTTLGCLADGAVLSLEEIRALHQVCDAWRGKLRAEPALVFNRARVIDYSCRSLERVTLSTETVALDIENSIISTITIQAFEWGALGMGMIGWFQFFFFFLKKIAFNCVFLAPADDDGSGAARYAEFSEEGYYERVQSPGNRESHYRGDAAGK